MFQPDWLILRILHQSVEIERPKGHESEFEVRLYSQAGRYCIGFSVHISSTCTSLLGRIRAGMHCINILGVSELIISRLTDSNIQQPILNVLMHLIL